MSQTIFISYRREDSQGSAGRIYDRLTATFDHASVFYDVDNIDPGVDFVEVLSERVGACDVLVAVIGSKWISVEDEAKRPRLENPEDFVRVEIEAALERQVLVIPVLVEGARMPKAHELPGRLKSLARRNAIEISHSRFHSDTERLLKVLRERLETSPEPKSRPVAKTAGKEALEQSDEQRRKAARFTEKRRKAEAARIEERQRAEAARVKGERATAEALRREDEHRAAEAGHSLDERRRVKATSVEPLGTRTDGATQIVAGGWRAKLGHFAAARIDGELDPRSENPRVKPPKAVGAKPGAIARRKLAACLSVMLPVAASAYWFASDSSKVMPLEEGRPKAAISNETEMAVAARTAPPAASTSVQPSQVPQSLPTLETDKTAGLSLDSVPQVSAEANDGGNAGTSTPFGAGMPAPKKVKLLPVGPDGSVDTSPQHGFAVQLAAPLSEEDARSATSHLLRKYPTALSGYRLGFRKSNLYGRIAYRVRVSDLNKDEASGLCNKLKAEGGTCFVTKN